VAARHRGYERVNVGASRPVPAPPMQAGNWPIRRGCWWPWACWPRSW